jgi:hypothetical protein
VDRERLAHFGLAAQPRDGEHGGGARESSHADFSRAAHAHEGVRHRHGAAHASFEDDLDAYGESYGDIPYDDGGYNDTHGGAGGYDASYGMYGDEEFVERHGRTVGPSPLHRSTAAAAWCVCAMTGNCTATTVRAWVGGRCL